MYLHDEKKEITVMYTTDENLCPYCNTHLIYDYSPLSDGYGSISCIFGCDYDWCGKCQDVVMDKEDHQCAN